MHDGCSPLGELVESIEQQEIMKTRIYTRSLFCTHIFTARTWLIVKSSTASKQNIKIYLSYDIWLDCCTRAALPKEWPGCH